MKEIKVISTSECANCQLLYNAVLTIVKVKGIDAKVEKVIDVKEVVKYGVMTTPLLVVNGVLKHVGTPIPSPQKLEELLSDV
ncbi:glutaredoxin family protein [Hydrogenobacter thermophilus TK-6]|uniref:Glutaredoxin family protein n=1 Tax=Hydrogenobacter thermophilus (strain DSM 6534 / IAM 12695 / TK-6) TaxID=608538 RepID=D3DK71_HYDTT|nr:thioredoxin family protein [Hydrogenobacter thermophilus]ADO46142.1 glutaredoxin family protein [Hydrogenobacter thermophilus TK-6]BAI70223.1 glutaredoxin family protein [Hydrogenobacter thermophilus TK-6]